MIDVILRHININVPSQGEMIFKITADLEFAFAERTFIGKSYFCCSLIC